MWGGVHATALWLGVSDPRFCRRCVSGTWLGKLACSGSTPGSGLALYLAQKTVQLVHSPQVAGLTSLCEEGALGSLVFLECVYNVEWDLNRKLDAAARNSVPR